MENKEINNDEINLKELIEVLLKGKIFIIVITILFTACSFLYTLILFDYTYEATAKVYVNPIEEFSSSNGSDITFEAINKYASMNIHTYIERIKTPEILNEVIEKLDYRNEEGNFLSYESLLGLIKISNTEDTNIISITVTNKQPEKASKISNEILNQLISNTKENISDAKDDTLQNIKNQISIEKENIVYATNGIKEFINTTTSIVELKAEINSLISIINSNKVQIIEYINNNKADSESLSVLLSESNISDIDNIGNITIGDNYEGSLYKEYELGNISKSELQSALITIEITMIQTRLVQNTAYLNVIENSNEVLKERLLEKQKQLLENENEYSNLSKQLTMSTTIYDQYILLEKEVEIFTNTNGINDTISTYSLAEKPTNPTGTGKSMYILIGIVLGLFIGCGFVLFRHYWKNTEV